MHINNRRQYFQDSLTELLGVKAGLAVTTERATRIFHPSPPSWWNGNRDEGVRLEATEYEEAFVTLLHGVGVIESPTLGIGQLVAFARKHEFALPEEWRAYGMEMQPNMARVMARTMYLQTLILDHLHEGTSIPSELSSNAEFKRMIEQYELRSVNHGMPASREWDGVVDLDDLFQSESAPKNPETFFDQRFIDYLSSQPDDLSAIHWRQFEFLAAEYFKRVGYNVTVGPGRGDGGKDVTAVRNAGVVGPEMVLVQCKRYKDTNEVSIDEVKAFYQTVTDESATRGVFATTSCFAKGARDYCNAREYRLKAADAEHVREWISAMKTVQTRDGRVI